MVDLLKRLDDDGIEHLSVIYHDYSGRSCAKTVPRERFGAVVRHGVVFARANLSFRVDDHQSEGASFLADTGDFLAVPDPDSYTPAPGQDAGGRVHAFMRTEDGSPWEGCPRERLLAMTEAFAERDLSVRVGLEPEFFLFERTPDGEYRPADRDGMFTLAGLDRHHGLWRTVMGDLRSMGIVLDQLGKEYGPAQYEGTPAHGAPLEAVDHYLAFREVVRNRAREAGWVASFMPKPYAELPGCGLHVHLSLWDRGGERELTPGEDGGEPLSEIGRRFAAGLLAHARGLTGIGSPIVNSYKRLLPGSWAPAHICWGVGNRSALVRIPGLGQRRRVEYRSGDNAANPFLYVCTLMAAGLDGIRNEMELPPPVGVDAGHLSTAEAQARGLEFLPSSLPDALDAFEADAVLTEALGPVISTEFLNVKCSELAAYDLTVHPWERAAYLETF